MCARFTISFLALFSFLLPTSFAQSLKNSSATAPAPLFGTKLKLTGLPNAGKISDQLFRGAQPRSEGFHELKSLGITTIVDLRGEDNATIAWERKQAESAGIHFVNIAVSGWSPPTDSQVVQFLSLFSDPHEKIFVHCRFGDDRTGVFVATYRMAHDHWNSAHALSEMYFFGFNGFWHPAMKTYVSVFPDHLKSYPDLLRYSLAK